MLRGVLPGGGPEPGAGADPENSEEREREGKKRSKINQYLTKLEILCTHRSIAKPG